MSALPPKADIDGRRLHVRFVPNADIQQWLRHVPSTIEIMRQKFGGLRRHRFAALQRLCGARFN